MSLSDLSISPSQVNLQNVPTYSPDFVQSDMSGVDSVFAPVVTPEPTKPRFIRDPSGMSLRSARKFAQENGFGRFWKLPKSALVPHIDEFKRTGRVPDAVRRKYPSTTPCETGNDCISNRCLDDVCVTSKQWKRRMSRSVVSTPSPSPSPEMVKAPALGKPKRKAPPRTTQSKTKSQPQRQPQPPAQQKPSYARPRKHTTKKHPKNANRKATAAPLSGTVRNKEFVCEVVCRPASKASKARGGAWGKKNMKPTSKKVAQKNKC